jgi:hypothetical protein
MNWSRYQAREPQLHVGSTCSWPGVEGDARRARRQALHLGELAQFGDQLLQRLVLEADGHIAGHRRLEPHPAVDAEVLEEHAREAHHVAVRRQLQAPIAEEEIAHPHRRRRDDPRRDPPRQRAAEVHRAREQAAQRHRRVAQRRDRLQREVLRLQVHVERAVPAHVSPAGEAPALLALQRDGRDLDAGIADRGGEQAVAIGVAIDAGRRDGDAHLAARVRQRAVEAQPAARLTDQRRQPAELPYIDAVGA